MNISPSLTDQTMYRYASYDIASGRRSFDIRHQFAFPTGVAGRVAGWLMAHANRAFAQWAIAALGPRPADHVVDIGCGPGVAVQALGWRLAHGRVTGIDPSEAMLAQARRRTDRLPASRHVRVVHGYAEALPFADGEIDGALSIDSLPFWTDVVQGLRELRRVLRTGGRAVFVIQLRPAGTAAELHAIADQYRGLIRAAGFNVSGCLLRRRRPLGGFLLSAQRPG